MSNPGRPLVLPADEPVVEFETAEPVAEFEPAEPTPVLAGSTPDVVRAAAEQILAAWRNDPPEPGMFPGTATRVMEILNHADPDFNRLVQTLTQDRAIAAKLLATANSAYYAGRNQVTGIREAVMRLGMREVSRIALAFASRALFDTQSKKEYKMFPHVWDALYHESMTAAFSASSLAMTVRGGDADRAFLAGMLHDIGKPIALRALARLEGKGIIGWALLHELIPQLLDAIHIEVGVSAMLAWKMPAYLQASAARHHELALEKKPELIETHVVRVIDGIRILRGPSIAPEQQQTLDQSCEVLGLDAHRRRVASTEHAEFAKRVSGLFGVPDPVRRAS